MDPSELANGIHDAINNAEDHIGFIQRALHQAQGYADGLQNTTSVDPALLREGASHLRRGEKIHDLLVQATECALELRRAGDVALNDHYD